MNHYEALPEAMNFAQQFSKDIGVRVRLRLFHNPANPPADPQWIISGTGEYLDSGTWD